MTDACSGLMKLINSFLSLDNNLFCFDFLWVVM